MPTNLFITNGASGNLGQRLRELISTSREMRALVGFFYFSGVKVLHEALRENPGIKLRVLGGMEADLVAVVAYRVLQAALREVPRLGSINLHGSLLPDYRGAAPIERALMDGATRTGLTTFLLERGVDTGRILEQVETPVGEDETAGELRADERARPCCPQRAGAGGPRRNPTGGVSARRGRWIACWISVWARGRTTASALPGRALALFRGQPLQVLRARVEREEGANRPGLLRKQGGRLFVACGAGELEGLELAAAGRNRLAAAAWLAGARLRVDEHLERVPLPGPVTQPGDAA